MDVVKAGNLKASDRGRGGARASDPYCVVLWSGKQIGETEVVDNDLNPEWNETFIAPCERDLVGGRCDAVARY